jgi:indole-3-glycerol phosphate synthase
MAARDVLKEIVQKKKERLDFAKAGLPVELLKERIAGCAAVRPFRENISKPKQISLIAEIKKASASCGVIRPDCDPVSIARQYAAAGVQALSVLTEEDYFAGSLQNLADARAVMSVPILRKDFLTEPYQVYEARAYGADCILLIAAHLVDRGAPDEGPIDGINGCCQRTRA